MKSIKSVVVLAAVGLAVVLAFALRSGPPEEPVVEKATPPVIIEIPTFIELGSDRCTSCRAMIPVLNELRSTNACDVNVRFIDVWDNPAEGERFSVRTIPTQVLLAPDGQELTRHTGFWSADAIREAFAKGGYTLKGEPGGCGT